jgi:hypothetical protein
VIGASRHFVACIRQTNALFLDEGRKRVLAIIAGALTARHLTNPEDLNDSRPTPRTESLVASAVQWAERIMRKVDSACSGK